MSFTVTATQGGSTAVGTAILVRVVTGQNASPIGNTAGATSTTPSLSITPNATGSWVYGANLGLAGTYTANGSTTYEANNGNASLRFLEMRTTATTTAATPVTVGGTATANSISIALLEITAGAGLAEDASSPAAVFQSSATSATTAAFTPPGSSLLVAMVTANGGASTTTMGITDTSGLGLVWTEQVKQNTAGDGYSGIWTAPVGTVPPLTNSFEGGTNGTTISAANSGGASGTAFDAVTISGTGAALTFDSTHAAHGTLAADVVAGSGSSLTYGQWAAAMGTLGQCWFRMYLYFTANPSSAPTLFTGQNGATISATLKVTTAGKLQWTNTSGTTIITSTAAIPLNQWFRVEGFVTASATAGQVETKLFNSPDAVTPDETDTSAASQNTSTQLTVYRYGITAAIQNVSYWMDDIGLSASGYIGPSVTATATPQPLTAPSLAAIQAASW